MVKMHDIRRSSADVKAEKKAMGRDSEHAYVPPEDDGARFEFEHHHLEKMGVGGDLRHGDSVRFHGHGTVEQSTSGERNRATIRSHHGAVDREFKSGDGEERMALRSDLEKAHGKAEEKSSKVKDDKKIPEKGGK
jgi:hypothetical protein